MAAVADDDELAARTADQKPAKPTVPLSEFGPDVERLNVIADRLGELISLQVAKVTQKKPRPVKPYPRPVTAAQRAAQRRREESHANTSLRLLGERSMYYRG